MATTALKYKFEFPEGLLIHKPELNDNISGIKKHSLLDWYKLTEATRHVLNSVITQTGRLQLEEMEKEHPDAEKLNQLRELSRLAMELSRDSKIFENKQQMIEIINLFENIEIG